MYIELDDLVCHMLSCSEAFFDIDNYLLYYRFELPSDADSINILQLPKVDETRVIESFIDKHPHLRRKIERQNKALADGFHRIVNDEGLYDEWTQFRWAFLQDVAADWCNQNNIKFTKKSKHPPQREDILDALKQIRNRGAALWKTIGDYSESKSDI